MIKLSEALYATMAGDAGLTDLLGQWRDMPSILTKRPIPANVGRPLVLAAATPSDVPGYRRFKRDAREIQRDIVIYGKAPDDHDAVINAAERVLALFHRNNGSISVTGYRTVFVHATGPIDAPVDSADQVGRVVTLTVGLDKAA